MFGLELDLSILLVLCLVAACAFEFINGFHDTANAVATVIYTHSMKPIVAVIWSGICNMAGVFVGGIAVAIGIINLLPLEALVDSNTSHAIAMVMALIITAIIWNLATWYYGIPCSSSHTLIGSIFGVGLAYMLLPGNTEIALNWKKVKDVGLSLMVSPMFGFFLSMLLILIMRVTIKNKIIFKEPPAKKAPPVWIRSILILTCTSVSFSHGSNDGQKGVGLIMLILIGIVPAHFALQMQRSPESLQQNITRIENTLLMANTSALNAVELVDFEKLKQQTASIRLEISGLNSLSKLPEKERFQLRKEILTLTKKFDGIYKNKDGGVYLALGNNAPEVKKSLSEVRAYTEYAPWWVILMVSLSLGIGTMVGWKRIVVTIGEKIGKTHLTYAQGASAELVAASTIAVSTYFGLPVSTTHVLSSGVAGSMASSGGLQNLQRKTITNIVIAWLVTLPVTILLSATLFLLFRLFAG